MFQIAVIAGPSHLLDAERDLTVTAKFGEAQQITTSDNALVRTK